MTIAITSPAVPSVRERERLRVMVVDDAFVVRAMISRWVEDEPDMQIVASVRGAREAIDLMERKNPDVVIHDVTMPDMDGLSALPRLLEKKRNLVVLMVSTLTRRNAEISLQARSLGAADYIPKPEGYRELMSSSSFQRELIDKIRVLGFRRKQSGGERAAAPTIPGNGFRRELALADDASKLDAPSIAPAAAEAGNIVLRPVPSTKPRVLLIGASTGGPPALNAVLGAIGRVIDHAPVLITQHMPSTFTTILTEHLSRASGLSDHARIIHHQAVLHHNLTSFDAQLSPSCRFCGRTKVEDAIEIEHHHQLPVQAMDASRCLSEPALEIDRIVLLICCRQFQHVADGIDQQPVGFAAMLDADGKRLADILCGLDPEPPPHIDDRKDASAHIEQPGNFGRSERYAGQPIRNEHVLHAQDRQPEQLSSDRGRDIFQHVFHGRHATRAYLASAACCLSAASRPQRSNLATKSRRPTRLPCSTACDESMEESPMIGSCAVHGFDRNAVARPKPSIPGISRSVITSWKRSPDSSSASAWSADAAVVTA